MGQDKGATGSDAGWENTQSKKSFNKDERWTGKSDSEVKTNIEQRNERRKTEQEFKNYNKPPTEYTGASLTMKMLNWVGNAVGQSKFAKDSNRKNREFFTDKVLSKKGVYSDGKTLSKTEFQSLSLERQNEIYSGYMSDRMSGKTDAYGNPIGGNRRETIKHRKADGTYITKEVWMGGNEGSGQQEMTQQQITQQTEAQIEADKKNQAADEQADYSKKKRLSVTSSRSLFANEGGRGFFN